MWKLSNWLENHWHGLMCGLGIHEWGQWYPNRNERGHRLGFSTKYCKRCGVSAQKRDR